MKAFDKNTSMGEVSDKNTSMGNVLGDEMNFAQGIVSAKEDAENASESGDADQHESVE